MEFLLRTSTTAPMQSKNKFHKLFVEGFYLNNCEISVLSSIPVVPTSHRKKLWFFKSEIENGVRYFYLPFINIIVVKHLMIFINSFLHIVYLIWKSRNKSVLIIDGLCTSLSISVILISKITNIKTLCVLTDLPQMIQQTLNIKNPSFLEICSYKLNKRFLTNYSGYVFLTCQMNGLINKKNKPYCVIEGFVDARYELVRKETASKGQDILLYSGGLFEKYGVLNLIEAFMKLKQKDIELSIYGAGDLEKEIKEFCFLDTRIRYYGMISNELMISKQNQATLLVNPRPTGEEFTKYSFPSKILDYMLSGTPLVTTYLPGIPDEYYNYVYTFKNDKSETLTNTINELLTFNRNDFIEMGLKGQDFVQRNKNNVVQSQKALGVIRSILS